MRKYGLIGKSLKHSFSPKFFSEKFEQEKITDASYQAFELNQINQVETILQDQNALGFNITIPYKKDIIAYADVLSNTVKEVGACNTFKRLDNNRWEAHNTDVPGFEQSFTPLLKKEHEKALILGNGGAALAVKHVLSKLNIPFTIVSRNASSKDCISYNELDRQTIQENHIIINTSPLGTYPDISSYPDIPYQELTAQHYLYDLVYNPKISAFLMKGKRQGCVIKNGLEMLHLQAQISWEIWNKS